MAEKRMFTQKIVDSDAFLDMPLSTQALYFHLNMRADDDGFVNNPKRIQRTIGASEDDLKLLIAKRFLIGFESGVIVIKHWRMHNTLRKDRYNPTQYQEELALLEVKDNNSYTESLATTWQPNGNHLATQYSKDKYSGVKESIGECSRVENPPLTPTLSQITSYILETNLNVNPERFFNYYNETDWKTTKGNPVDWKKKLKEWDASETVKHSNKSSGNVFLDLLNDETG